MRRVSCASTSSLVDVARGRRRRAAIACGVISWNTIRRTGTFGLSVCDQVPGDGLALAVLVRGEVELVGVLDQRLELADLLLAVRADDVERLEVVVDVDAEARPGLALVLRPGRRRRCAAGRGCGRSRPRRRSPVPRYPPIVFAFAGDSTITSLVPVPALSRADCPCSPAVCSGAVRRRPRARSRAARCRAAADGTSDARVGPLHARRSAAHSRCRSARRTTAGERYRRDARRGTLRTASRKPRRAAARRPVRPAGAAAWPT